MAPNGFPSSNSLSTKWTKHGQIVLLVPGHDPPIDITIFMDIQPQPGPNTSHIRSAAILHLNQHQGNSTGTMLIPENTRTLLYYSRNQLLDLRRSSVFEGQSTLFTTLKECEIFCYRGTRGRRKIPTIVSNCLARAHCSSPTQRNVSLANLTVISQTPFTPSGSPNRFKPTDFCLINARSINNKSFFIKNFVVDHDLDILAITETWTQPDLFEQNLIINCLCPTDYLFRHVSRETRGGGVAFLYKQSYKFKNATTTSKNLQIFRAGKLLNELFITNSANGSYLQTSPISYQCFYTEYRIYPCIIRTPILDCI